MADVTIPTQHGEVPVYLASPQGGGPWPGVVVIQDPDRKPCVSTDAFDIGGREITLAEHEARTGTRYHIARRPLRGLVRLTVKPGLHGAAAPLLLRAMAL